MNGKGKRADGGGPDTLAEIRTQRLSLVNDHGVEYAALGIVEGVVELRLGGEPAGLPCEILVYAGEVLRGDFTAGVELWANGESVAGSALTVAGSEIEVHHFGTGEDE